MVILLPIFILDALNVTFDVLGMVVKSPLPEPDIVPTHEPENVISNVWENEKGKVLLPFVSCDMTVLPDATVLVVFALIPIVLLPEYLVPFTVTDHALLALELILPEPVERICICQVTVLVLFAIF